MNDIGEDWREKGRKEATILIEEARRLKAEGKPEEAKAKYRESLQPGRDPTATNIMEELCRIFLEQGDIQGAEDVWKEAAMRVPGLGGEYYIHMACLYEEAGYIEKAILLLREGVAHFPRFTLTYSYLGKMCLRHGRPKEAAIVFRQAVDLDPGNNSYLYIYVVEALVADNRLQEACELITEIERSKKAQGYWLSELKKEQEKILSGMSPIAKK